VRSPSLCSERSTGTATAASGEPGPRSRSARCARPARLSSPPAEHLSKPGGRPTTDGSRRSAPSAPRPGTRSQTMISRAFQCDCRSRPVPNKERHPDRNHPERAADPAGGRYPRGDLRALLDVTGPLSDPEALRPRRPRDHHAGTAGQRHRPRNRARPTLGRSNRHLDSPKTHRPPGTLVRRMGPRRCRLLPINPRLGHRRHHAASPGPQAATPPAARRQVRPAPYERRARRQHEGTRLTLWGLGERERQSRGRLRPRAGARSCPGAAPGGCAR
jgi:hypothetical protein